jgi:hypothetical protein
VQLVEQSSDRVGRRGRRRRRFEPRKLREQPGGHVGEQLRRLFERKLREQLRDGVERELGCDGEPLEQRIGPRGCTCTVELEEPEEAGRTSFSLRPRRSITMR